MLNTFSSTCITCSLLLSLLLCAAAEETEASHTAAAREDYTSNQWLSKQTRDPLLLKHVVEVDYDADIARFRDAGVCDGMCFACVRHSVHRCLGLSCGLDEPLTISPSANGVVAGMLRAGVCDALAGT
jgi:hypothetical protein